MQKKIELLNIGCGNIGSVRRCFQRLNVDIVEVGTQIKPTGDYPLVFPGVGAFGAIADALQENDLRKVLVDLIEAETPYLGICVGMQILLDRSDESPNSKGLSIISGAVNQFKQGKVPQIGWNYVNSVDTVNNASGYAYFVNSYFATPEDPAVVSHYSNYFQEFCSGIKTNNITAYQFHPEKSSSFGEELIEKWLMEAA